MRKIILVLAILVVSTHLVTSQLYVISPNDTIEAFAPPNQLTIFGIYQRNISGGVIQLAWTKIYEDIPTGWDYSLCDKGTCYPGFPISGTMVTLITPTDSGLLDVNVDPFSLTGTLTVRFYVYETSAPLAGDTLTWILTSQTTGKEEITSTDFKLYPNPCTEYIQIDLQTELSDALYIYDLNGHIILQKPMIQNNERIDVSNMTPGTYILELRGKNIIRKSFIKE